MKNHSNDKTDPWYLKLALEEANKAFSLGEVPVGCVIVNQENQILSSSHNLKEKTNDPCGHAELIAIREAAAKLGNWRLTGCRLFVTLEPCSMCMGAIINARLKDLVFGAYDMKGGAISLGFNLHQNPGLNHRVNVVGGLEHYECSKLISDFFKQRRSLYGR